jgi:glycosyltransferase involved in cell wall biosynthesis
MSFSGLTTTGRIILPEDMAANMELLYSNKEVYDNLSLKSAAKFNSPRYSWKEIAKQWDKLFDTL